LVRKYGAFVLRYWHLGDDERRLAITHVQSGGQLLTSSPAAMLAWVQAQLDPAAASDAGMSAEAPPPQSVVIQRDPPGPARKGG
jgi:hypothetical protein